MCAKHAERRFLLSLLRERTVIVNRRNVYEMDLVRYLEEGRRSGFGSLCSLISSSVHLKKIAAAGCLGGDMDPLHWGRSCCGNRRATVKFWIHSFHASQYFFPFPPTVCLNNQLLKYPGPQRQGSLTLRSTRRCCLQASSHCLFSERALA